MRSRGLHCFHHALHLAAETSEVQGKLDETQTVLKQMGREAPNTCLYHFGVGKLNEHNRNLEAAAAEFRQAIRLDPKPSEAHSNDSVVVHITRLAPGAKGRRRGRRLNRPKAD